MSAPSTPTRSSTTSSSSQPPQPYPTSIIATTSNRTANPAAVSNDVAYSGFDLDKTIDQLLAFRSNRKPQSTHINLPEADVRHLALRARDVFMSQPPLLELQAPVKICGDIHGQFPDLLRLFEANGFPPHANYLFLGDYIDRGKHGMETICLLFALKIKFPENFFLLRGNHECATINRVYGFFDEVRRRYNVKLWKTFTDTFNCLPVAAVIDDKIFCCHGGISPELHNLNQIKKVARPTEVGDTGLVCDLLWSDPQEGLVGWGESQRGVSFAFGADMVQKFLYKHDLDLICRAHEVVEEGYQFFAKRQLITIFSAPNYCGELDNSGAVMSVDDDLMCSFSILKPCVKKPSFFGSSGADDEKKKAIIPK